MKIIAISLASMLLLASCSTLDVQRVSSCGYENGKQVCVESKPLITGTEAINWGILAVILGAVLGTTLHNQ